MHNPLIKRALRITSAAVAALIAGTAQAALQDRDLDGNGVTDAFYDTDLDITWLRDANVNSSMDWPTAVAWADGYSFGGYSDWRLPTSEACSGFNCTGSEMGHLWYVELGNSAGGPMTNVGAFQNLGAPYWSGTLFAGVDDYARTSLMLNGSQSVFPTSDGRLAMAVREGDVPAIPEPGAYALMLAGLAGLALQRRNRARD